MIIAIEGCAHGELEKIYTTIAEHEEIHGIKVDLLLICGDFQSTRNQHDLASMACPIKYREMCSFYKYYSGELTAPLPTVFIGGNHEASNYLTELWHGGWVSIGGNLQTFSNFAQIPPKISQIFRQFVGFIIILKIK